MESMKLGPQYIEKWDSHIPFLRMTGLGDKSVAPWTSGNGGIGYDDGYGFDLECAAKSNFQKFMDCQSRLWNMRFGPRHGGHMGDEYTYCVAFFDIADVNCGFATFPYFHPSRWSARRYGGPQEAACSDEPLVNNRSGGSRGPRMASSSQYLCHPDFRVSDGSRLRICGAGLVFNCS
jgi:hypothetical protein